MLKYLLSLFILVPYFASAQISLGTNDMPETMSYFLSTAILPPDNYVEAGENYDLDYSDLEVATQREVNYVSVSQAPFFYQFVFNNPSDPVHYADHATAQDGFSLGETASFSDFYAFF